MIEMIRLGGRGRCGQDCCDRLDIPDFNLDWKVLAVQGIDIGLDMPGDGINE